MENQNYGSVIGSSSAPFINALAATGTTISNYHSYGQGIGGCSAGCYEAFTAGQQHISDGWCPRASSPCSSESNIADQLNSAGLTSAMFCEDGCPRGADHFPWIGYTSTWNSCMTGSFTCNGQTGPDGNAIYGSSSSNSNTAFVNYLNSASPANYIWFTPSDNHNMHDNSVSSGDSYLQTLLVGTGSIANPGTGSVLATSLLKQPGTFLYLWWDEYDPSPNVEWGTMIKIGHTSSSGYTEYDSLHTIEANWGLPYITSVVGGDSGLTDIFGTSGPLPVSTSFTYTPNSPMVGTSVRFTATASGGISPYTYSWDFGDGSIATGSSATHAYTSAGTYTVTLTASDSASGTSKSTQTLTVAAIPALTASFSYSPTAPTTGTSVSFTGSASGGISPYLYSWTFGDGATDTGQSPTHTYVAAGNDIVTLTVTDSGGKTAQATKTVTITSIPQLSVSFNFSPAQPSTGQTVAIVASATGGTGPYSYNWNFGDGSTSTGPSTTHSFSSAGSFTVTLTVKDSSSTQQTAASQQTINVSNPVSTPTLAASFHTSPSNPNVGEQVSFTATATGGTSPYSYSWNFGDSSMGNGASTSHVYSATGTYTITLTATDTSTPQQSINTSLTVTVSQPPIPGTKPTYTLTFQGYDWDGGHEETVILNGQTLAKLPMDDSPQNQRIYVPFSLNITSHISTGTNKLVITHADWDCSVVDSVQDLQIISQTGNQTTTIYSSLAPQPLSCTQQLTYQFNTTPSTTPPPTNQSTYTLTLLGYDWDGGHEETVILNGHRIASLPTTDTSQNARIFVPFSLDITTYVVPGINTLTIVHANWDCAVVDSVENLQVTFQSGEQTTTIYANTSVQPLSCTQQVTYTFVVPTA